MELVQPYEGKWIFQDAAITNEIESKFVEALDAYNDGLHEEAEASIRQVLTECPNHIDALHHLGLFLEDRGDALGSYMCCQAAVAVGLQAIPETFRWADDKMMWSHLTNQLAGGLRSFEVYMANSTRRCRLRYRRFRRRG